MLVLLFLLFAGLSGLIEAVLFSRRAAEAFTRNEHAEMVLQRLAVWLMPLAGIWLYNLAGSLLYVAAELLAAVLLFAMVHDEAYNFARLWIKHSERYAGMATIPGSLNPDRAAFRAARIEYRYGYQSPTTTARNDFNGKQRTALAVSGLLLWAAGGITLIIL